MVNRINPEYTAEGECKVDAHTARQPLSKWEEDSLMCCITNEGDGRAVGFTL